ncbi:nucleoside-diphosphate kinase [Rhizobium grahamii]|uniref:Nucleoside diphosphate kinase n=1 Tax=Rhizobium grahamii CCGE 502 TaxID=990285 RepID=S3I420_9HYPH|nr:nucleoside-diphosphate kinase [Rhizobium grahamii]EPE94388.1 nucleoside diphosphate kinase [Rhizobium grahamii CCGE 502]
MQARADQSGRGTPHLENDILDGHVAGDPSAPTWRAVTRIPVKAELYGRETYFREGLTDASESLAADMIAALHRSALVMLKPEGLAGGKASAIVEFLRAHGFGITAVIEHTLSRLEWRELWRFQLTAASLDRLAVNDLILQDRVLLLLLHDNGPLRVPATVRLGVLKGPADLDSQPQNCLRRLLAQPNRLFSFCHVADEPADLLRELAILCDRPMRRSVLSRFAVGVLPRREIQLLDETLLASDRIAREFDVQASLQRLAQAACGCSGAATERILVDIARMHRGETIVWRAFATAVAEAGLEIDRWDLALLGATFIVPDEPGASKMIGSVRIDSWL